MLHFHFSILKKQKPLLDAEEGILGNVVHPSQADTLQSNDSLSRWRGRKRKGTLRNSQRLLLHLFLLLSAPLAGLWHCPVSGQQCIDLAGFLPCSGNTENRNSHSNAVSLERNEHSSKMLPQLISQLYFPTHFSL